MSPSPKHSMLQSGSNRTAILLLLLLAVSVSSGARSEGDSATVANVGGRSGEQTAERGANDGQQTTSAVKRNEHPDQSKHRTASGASKETAVPISPNNHVDPAERKVSNQPTTTRSNPTLLVKPPKAETKKSSSPIKNVLPDALLPGQSSQNAVPPGRPSNAPVTTSPSFAIEGSGESKDSSKKTGSKEPRTSTPASRIGSDLKKSKKSPEVPTKSQTARRATGPPSTEPSKDTSKARQIQNNKPVFYNPDLSAQSLESHLTKPGLTGTPGNEPQPAHDSRKDRLRNPSRSEEIDGGLNGEEGRRSERTGSSSSDNPQVSRLPEPKIAPEGKKLPKPPIVPNNHSPEAPGTSEPRNSVPGPSEPSPKPRPSGSPVGRQTNPNKPSSEPSNRLNSRSERSLSEPAQPGIVGDPSGVGERRIERTGSSSSDSPEVSRIPVKRPEQKVGPDGTKPLKPPLLPVNHSPEDSGTSDPRKSEPASPEATQNPRPSGSPVGRQANPSQTSSEPLKSSSPASARNLTKPAQAGINGGPHGEVERRSERTSSSSSESNGHSRMPEKKPEPTVAHEGSKPSKSHILQNNQSPNAPGTSEPRKFVPGPSDATQHKRKPSGSSGQPSSEPLKHTIPASVRNLSHPNSEPAKVGIDGGPTGEEERRSERTGTSSSNGLEVSRITDKKTEPTVGPKESKPLKPPLLTVNRSTEDSGTSEPRKTLPGISAASQKPKPSGSPVGRQANPSQPTHEQNKSSSPGSARNLGQSQKPPTPTEPSRSVPLISVPESVPSRLEDPGVAKPSLIARPEKIESSSGSRRGSIPGSNFIEQSKPNEKSHKKSPNAGAQSVLRPPSSDLPSNPDNNQTPSVGHSDEPNKPSASASNLTHRSSVSAAGAQPEPSKGPPRISIPESGESSKSGNNQSRAEPASKPRPPSSSLPPVPPEPTELSSRTLGSSSPRLPAVEPLRSSSPKSPSNRRHSIAGSSSNPDVNRSREVPVVAEPSLSSRSGSEGASHSRRPPQNSSPGKREVPHGGSRGSNPGEPPLRRPPNPHLSRPPVGGQPEHAQPPESIVPGSAPNIASPSSSLSPEFQGVAEQPRSPKPVLESTLKPPGSSLSSGRENKRSPEISVVGRPEQTKPSRGLPRNTSSGLSSKPDNIHSREVAALSEPSLRLRPTGPPRSSNPESNIAPIPRSSGTLVGRHPEAAPQSTPRPTEPFNGPPKTFSSGSASNVRRLRPRSSESPVVEQPELIELSNRQPQRSRPGSTSDIFQQSSGISSKSESKPSSKFPHVEESTKRLRPSGLPQFSGSPQSSNPGLPRSIRPIVTLPPESNFRPSLGHSEPTEPFNGSPRLSISGSPSNSGRASTGPGSEPILWPRLQPFNGPPQSSNPGLPRPIRHRKNTDRKRSPEGPGAFKPFQNQESSETSVGRHPEQALESTLRPGPSNFSPGSPSNIRRPSFGLSSVTSRRPSPGSEPILRPRFSETLPNRNTYFRRPEQASESTLRRGSSNGYHEPADPFNSSFRPSPRPKPSNAVSSIPDRRFPISEPVPQNWPGNQNGVVGPSKGQSIAMNNGWNIYYGNSSTSSRALRPSSPASESPADVPRTVGDQNGVIGTTGGGHAVAMNNGWNIYYGCSGPEAVRRASRSQNGVVGAGSGYSVTLSNGWHVYYCGSGRSSNGIQTAATSSASASDSTPISSDSQPWSKNQPRGNQNGVINAGNGGDSIAMNNGWNIYYGNVAHKSPKDADSTPISSDSQSWSKNQPRSNQNGVINAGNGGDAISLNNGWNIYYGNVADISPKDAGQKPSDFPWSDSKDSGTDSEFYKTDANTEVSIPSGTSRDSSSFPWSSSNGYGAGSSGTLNSDKSSEFPWSDAKSSSFSSRRKSARSQPWSQRWTGDQNGIFTGRDEEYGIRHRPRAERRRSRNRSTDWPGQINDLNDDSADDGQQNWSGDQNGVEGGDGVAMNNGWNIDYE